jgi:hypothetical protein
MVFLLSHSFTMSVISLREKLFQPYAPHASMLAATTPRKLFFRKAVEKSINAKAQRKTKRDINKAIEDKGFQTKVEAGAL